ncbi:hypothetical protein [Segatella albensis]|jgi:hypothetical protein|uniref:hypothetical protein n=1 Tax=Segatella albensis TaxID=77768 RepID=UPI0004695474|nr:hypothetical protein [Segatella albensis]
MEEKDNIQESEVVRPHHRQKRLISYQGKNDSTIVIRNWLNIIFMVLAIGGVATYMWTSYKTVAFVILLIAVVFKIIEVAIRLFHKS